jgi:hypothetical protein
VPSRPGLLLLSFPPNPSPGKPTSNGTHRNSASQSAPSGSAARLARLLLAQELGGEPERRSLSAAAEVVWQKLSDRLSRLVSVAGSHAMLSRALHLARPEFAFLDGVRAGHDECFDDLEEALCSVDAAAADKALLTVLTNLIDLLVGFIGEELTLGLVGEVWPALALRDQIQPGTFDGEEAAS